MSDKPKQCSNCWSSMFRKMKGEMTLYCGYWYKPVALDYLCDMHNKSMSCGGRQIEPKGKEAQKKPVYIIEPNGKKMVFHSMTEAANYLNMPLASLSNSLTKGYRARRRKVGFIE